MRERQAAKCATFSFDKFPLETRQGVSIKRKKREKNRNTKCERKKKRFLVNSTLFYCIAGNSL